MTNAQKRRVNTRHGVLSVRNARRNVRKRALTWIERACEAAGMDGFLAKPITLDTLRAVLKTLPEGDG